MILSAQGWLQVSISFNSCFHRKHCFARCCLNLRGFDLTGSTLPQLQWPCNFSFAINISNNDRCELRFRMKMKKGEKSCAVKVKVEVSHYDCFDAIKHKMKWFRLRIRKIVSLRKLFICTWTELQSVYFIQRQSQKFRRCPTVVFPIAPWTLNQHFYSIIFYAVY